MLRTHKKVLNNQDVKDRVSGKLIPDDLEQAIMEVQLVLGNSADLLVYKFHLSVNTKCTLIYLKSFVDFEKLSTSILTPLMKQKNLPEEVRNLLSVLPYPDIEEIHNLDRLCQKVVEGEVILLFSCFKSGLAIPLKKYEQRSITEPENEKVVRGPRDCFVESIWSNIGMMRQKVKNPNLRVELITTKTATSVEVAIIYMEGIANSDIVGEIRSRVKRIEVDKILCSTSLSELITDSPWSPFPTLQYTERPDRLTMALFNGQIGILLDGTPIVSVAPVVFWDFLKSVDDYYENPYFVSLVRLTRLVSHLVTLLLPGGYVALTSIHLEMLPQSLAVIIAGARTRTPFPTAVELLAMEVVVEILREAGLRMPGVFGQTISIVGALVIGEAAVTAGLIEPTIVVVVAFTTLASFMVPGYNAAVSIRILRFPLILLSASLGFFGLALGAFAYLLHLVSLRSFGVPYFAPVAPLFLKDMKDLFIRLPGRQLNRRPSVYRPEDNKSSPSNQKPGPERVD